MSRSTGRLLTGVLLVCAVFWVWAHTSGAGHLADRARARLLRMAVDASLPGHRLQLGGMELDLGAGRLSITDAAMDLEPWLLDSLRQGSVQLLFAAKAGRIELREVSIWRLLLLQELQVQAIELTDLELRYWVGGGRQGSYATSTRNGPPDKLDLVRLLHADTLLISNASAWVEDVSDAVPDLEIARLDMTLLDLDMYRHGLRSGVRLAVNDGDLKLHSAYARLPDGHQLSIGGAVLPLGQGKGVVHDVRWWSDAEGSVARGLTLQLDSLVVQGLDLHRLLADQGMFVGHTHLHGLRVELFLDKTMAGPDTLRRALPPEALLAWQLPMRMDTLALHAAQVVYKERSALTGRWGSVPITDLDLVVQGMANHHIAAPLEALLEARIFGAAPLKVFYSAKLDGSGHFLADVGVGAMPLELLDPVLGPLARMHIRAGQLDSLRMRIEGDDRLAKGRVALDYAGLVLGPEPGTPPEVAHQQFSSILAELLDERHGGGLEGHRERHVRILRDSTRTLPHYLWSGLRKGLMRDMRGDVRQRVRELMHGKHQRP